MRYSTHHCLKCDMAWTTYGRSHSQCPDCTLSKIEKILYESVVDDSKIEDDARLMFSEILFAVEDYLHGAADTENVEHFHESGLVTLASNSPGKKKDVVTEFTTQKEA